MPNRDATRLETLIEANDQFHWGTDPDAAEAAAGALDRLRLNPALARALKARAARVRTVAWLLRDGLAAAAPSPSLAAAPRLQRIPAASVAVPPSTERNNNTFGPD